MQRCIGRSTRQAVRGRGHCTAQLHSVKEAASCLLGVVLLLAPSALAYGDGARSESCYDMMTNHTDTFSGSLAPPISCGAPCQFSIQVVARVDHDNENNRMRVEENITAYECDAVYEVVIRTTQNPFNGYMAEARSPTADGSFTETSSIWGEWLYSGTDDFHSVNCKRSLSSETGDEFPGAVTQDQPVYPINGSVSLYWKAPGATQRELPDSLVFWVTIVESLATSFTPVNGTELIRNCEPLLPSSSSSSTPTRMVTMTSTMTQQSTSDGESPVALFAGIAAGAVLSLGAAMAVLVAVVIVVRKRRKYELQTPEVRVNTSYGVAAHARPEKANPAYGVFKVTRDDDRDHKSPVCQPDGSEYEMVDDPQYDVPDGEPISTTNLNQTDLEYSYPRTATNWPLPFTDRAHHLD